MLPDRVSNPGPLTYESGALQIALRGLVKLDKNFEIHSTLDVLKLKFITNYRYLKVNFLVSENLL